MNQNARVRQREPFTFGAGRQQQRAHRGAHADADRGHIGTDKLHRVVDRHTRSDRSARRIDIKVNVLFGIFSFEEKQLGDNQVCDLIVDRRAEKNDVVFQQP